MSDVRTIDQILGPERAARVVRQLAADIAHQDHVEPDRALRMVCDRVLAGDPLLIASPGQTWILRDDIDDIDPDDLPTRRLAVIARLSEPPRVVAFDPDIPDSTTDELLLSILTDFYQLESWHLPDQLLDEGGHQ